MVPNDIQQNDTGHNNLICVTQHDDTQHNNTQHNDTQHKILICDTLYKSVDRTLE
jgi:hypothetical protein